MRLTLGEIKTNSGIPRLLGLCSTDSRIATYVNRAQERLLNRGTWYDSTARYAVAATKATITWPREFAAIESYAIDETPGKIRDQWFDFLESGIGLQDADCGDAGNLIVRGEACCVDNIDTNGRKILVMTDSTEDEGSKILFQGNGTDGKRIWTEQSDGSWVDGVYVSMSEAITDYEDDAVTGVDFLGNSFSIVSSGFVSSVGFDVDGLVTVQKPITKGRVRIYEYDEATQTANLMSIYNPTETVPHYRQSIIPGYGTPTTPCTVTVVAKRSHVPVVNDYDFLVIGCTPALEEMVMALKHMDNRELEKAEIYEQRALRELDRELDNYRGTGTVSPLRIESQGYGAGNLEDVR